ncbi:MAG: FAD-dependent oxidoreductase [Fibrobacteres bacterium]|nr:FAD-dependent oxidoreductase [Fibrobacterota bacterium]
MTNHKAKFNVLVAGGGLSGVCAAIAAARELKRQNLHQAKVAFVHDRAMPGGCSSSEVRVPPIGAGRNIWGTETGIIYDLLLEERRRNHIHWSTGTVNSIWDLVLFEALKAESNIVLFLNTSIRKSITSKNPSDNRTVITAVEACQLGTEKEWTLEADLFIDCTGDGTVAASAGASFRMGREARSEFNESLAPEVADDAVMGSSLLFQAKDIGHPVPFTAPEWAEKYPTEESLAARPHSTFTHGYYWIEVGMPYNPLIQNEEQRDEIMRHVLGVWDHLKNHCPYFSKKAENWALDWIGFTTGKRESRRIIGEYMLNENDLRARRLFEDRVAFGGHFLDLHTIGGLLAKGKPGNPVDDDPDLWDRSRMRPYPIPLRSLVCRDVSNLFMAGRNLSATHVAFGSARVMLTCALMGEAVGTAAAIAISENKSPRDIALNDFAKVQQSLIRQGCFLHELPNSDPNDLARNAVVTASSEAELDITPNNSEYRFPMELPLGTLIPISSDRLDAVELFIESEASEPFTIPVRVRLFKDVWDFKSETVLTETSVTIPSGNRAPVKVDLNLKVKPKSLIFIETCKPAAKLFWRFRTDHPSATLSARQSLTTGFWNYIRHDGVKGFRLLCAKVFPASHPFKANEIISGITRPEKWTNEWVSDPNQKLPQSLELRWNSSQTMSTVEITFDTDLTLTNESIPPFTVPSKCVKDYSVQISQNGNWITVADIKSNGARRRVHSFNSVNTDAIRITVTSTHGDHSARIYEVRAYK